MKLSVYGEPHGSVFSEFKFFKYEHAGKQNCGFHWYTKWFWFAVQLSY